jgi:hypothetical protein
MHVALVSVLTSSELHTEQQKHEALQLLSAVSSEAADIADEVRTPFFTFPHFFSFEFFRLR